MGSFKIKRRHGRRQLFHFYLATLFCIIAVGGVPTAAWAALPGDQNKDPELCQGIAGAAYSVNVALAIFAPEPFDEIGENLAYIANLNLKLCQPQIAAPASKYGVEPDSTNACVHTFKQETTEGEYENILGAPILLRYPSDWGELGTPKTYHFNSAADVELLGVEEKDGEVEIPVGRNKLAWRADTTVSIIDFVPLHLFKLPAGTKAEKEVVESSPALRKVAEEGFKEYAKHVGKNAAKFVVEEGVKFSLNQVVGINFHHSQLGIFDDIYNTDDQDVWVYDRIPPKISTNTDNNSLDAKTAAILHYDNSSQKYILEAFQPGGVMSTSAIGVAKGLLNYSDSCDTHLTLNHTKVPNLWSVGDEVPITWTVSDPGPIHAPKLINGVPQDDGGHNTAQVTQIFKVQDTHPPILVAPPSKVVEVPPGTQQTDVPLGSPRVFDLVDLDSNVTNNHNNTMFDLGLSEVTWTATDDSGNSSHAVQLINIKEQGTNSVPVAHPQTVAATSFKPVDITLTASDADYHPSVGRYDPLTFSIVTPPSNGFFVAPLLPFFIDDYRLEASQFNQTDPQQADPKQYCDDQGHAVNTWDLKYPYDPSWMTVDDTGNTFVIDSGQALCQPGGVFEAHGRMVKFSPDGSLLASRSSSNEQDIFVDNESGLLFVLVVTGVAYEGSVDVFDKDAPDFGVPEFTTPRNLDLRDSVWGVQAPAAIAQDHQGVMYVMDRSGLIKAYKVDWSDQSAKYDAQDVYLATVPGNYGFPNIYDMAVDSHNNLYIEDYNHIVKLSAGSFDQDGNFIPPQFIGWMGKCTGNKTDTVACDIKQQRSIGFSCTDALCEAPNPSNGDKPGQFNLPEAIAVDPNDILYVGDTGNDRVQRFTPDGYYAGQAKSTGQGYGFILGDFDRVDNITVNSNNFYILQTKDPLGGNSGLLHVFQTTPITPIDDSSAKVTYQSKNNFQGTDSFVFASSDGLDSSQATVTVNVERDYRPPTIPHPPGKQTLTEDGSTTITLTGSDPDGALDVLSYEIVTPPAHGTAKILGDQVTYTPAPNYAGTDSFSYRAYDGLYYSNPAMVALTVTSVPDKPQVSLDAPAKAGDGFNMKLGVTVFDPDSGADHTISIDWGDDTPLEHDGQVTVDGNPVSGSVLNPDGTLPDNVDTTGPIYSRGANGYGSLNTDHTYTHAGTYTIMVCATDKGPIPLELAYTQASKGCGQTNVTVIPSVAYRLTADTSIADANPGDTVNFAFSLENRAFDTQPDDMTTGLSDTDVVVTGEASTGLVNLRVPTPAAAASTTDLGSLDQSCTVTSGSYRCELGTMPYDSKGIIHLLADIGPLAPGHASLSLTANVSGTAPEHEKTSSAAQVNIIAKNTPPHLESLTPEKGGIVDGTPVTLTGSDFQVGAVVYFGNQLGRVTLTKDSKTITAVAPPQTAGTVDVTVVNPDDKSAKLAQAFAYQAVAAGGSVSGGGGGGGSLGLLTLGFLLIFADRKGRASGR